MKFLLFCLLLVTGNLCGCQSDPWSFQYARSKPTTSLAGRYKPTIQSQNLLKEGSANGGVSQVELKKDQSFIIKNIPDAWAPFPTGSNFKIVSGQWSLVKHQDWWAVQLEVGSVREANGRINKNGFGTQAMLIGQEAPYTLHFGIGDPDAGKALQYEPE